MDEKEKYLSSIAKADSPIDAKEVDFETLTLFANKDRLKQITTTLYGNFTNNPNLACTYQYLTSVLVARVIEINDLRPCGKGAGTVVEIKLLPKK